ncbi:MAG: glycosyltransferase family 4 protein [Gemmatimonadales bacterium]
MKVLLVNWQDRRNPEAGGAEIHLFELFSRLARRGHTVRLICCGFEGGAAEESVDGIDVRRHGTRHSFAWRGLRAVSRAARSFQPDVIVDDINKLPLFTPLVTDRPLYAIVPHLFGATAFQEVAWPVAATVFAAELAIPRVYRRAWFHAISDSTRDDLVRRGIPRERIAVVYPGVDTRHFAPDANLPRRDPAGFVYIGRLKRYKGLDILIQALAIARRTRPDLSLDIAGTGDDRVRLEALAKSQGLSGTVRFHGFVNDATRLRLLREAVANVFPSPKEGWGITVMEAAACGTPSLASNSPGLRDSVRDGQTGVLVPHGDATRLAAEMLRLASDPALVDRLGGAARAWAECLTWDAAAHVVEQHLLNLAAGLPAFAPAENQGVPAAIS